MFLCSKNKPQNLHGLSKKKNNAYKPSQTKPKVNLYNTISYTNIRGLSLFLFDWVCKRYSSFFIISWRFWVFFRAEELEELRGEKLDERQVLRLFKQLSTRISDSNWVKKCQRKILDPPPKKKLPKAKFSVDIRRKYPEQRIFTIEFLKP